MKAFKPQLVSVRDESLVNELKEALSDVEHKPEIIPGEQGIIEVSFHMFYFSSSVDIYHLFLQLLDSLSLSHQVARHPDAVTVVTGIVGCAGLKVKL